MEKDKKLEDNIFRTVNVSLSKEDVLMLSPLQLAYIGDAVYELLVRTYLLERGLKVNELHKEATKYVKAKSQSDIIHGIFNLLNEDEKSYVKKGRNAKSNTSPKNANIVDYKYATGLECLFGYLYLNRRDNRMEEIFNEIIKLKQDRGIKTC